MGYQKGDTLVFTGNFDANPFYDNFKLGEHYVIESIQSVEYELDEVNGYDEKCILFKNYTYGALEKKAHLYFKSISEQRDRIISEITG